MRIIGAYDRGRWNGIVQSMPFDLRDVTLDPGYCEAQCKAGETAWLAFYDAETFTVAQSFIKRPIPSGRYDVRTLSGPVCSATIVSRRHGEAFANEWRDWCRYAEIVSEFCLLNPLFEGAQFPLIHDADSRREREVVFKKVASTDEMIGTLAKSQKQDFLAAKNNLDIRPVSYVNELNHIEFSRLYTVAMNSKNFMERWRLNADYFRRAVDLYGDRIAFVLIDDDVGAVKAGAMFTFGSGCAYYALAARAQDAPRGASLRAIMRGMELARDRGCAWMHLGGGVTAEPDDSLLAFKSAVGETILPAYSYRRVLDPARYQQLSVDSGAPDGTTFFPAYRWREAQP